MKTFASGVAAAALAAVACLAVAQEPPPLALTRRLADAGAVHLVLDRAERLQPADRTAPAWAQWEALRCSALAALGRHAALVERAATWSAEGPGVLATCYIGAASAALALSRTADARRYAGIALWQATLSPAQVQAMRRVVIDAYVAERRGDAAYRAMLRYQQDHRPLSREVLGAFVDGLLDCGMDKEALAWLSQLDDTQPARLRLRLRAGLVPREAAVSQARSAFAKGGDRAYWKVLLDAAHDDVASPLRIAVLEHILDVAAGPEAVGTAAQRLWDAYLAAAAGAANRAGLLVGDDASWADQAGRRLATEPELGRALFAHLSQRAQSAATRHNAQLQLVQAFRSERLERVGLRVFAVVFPDVDALDTQVRYHLGAMAEAAQQYADAARYWKDVPAPSAADGGVWLLRLARVRWLAGGGETGIDVVVRHYAERGAGTTPEAVALASSLAGALADRGEHAAALRLLEALLPHAAAAQKTPLLYALGRVRERAGKLPLAAEAYLAAALGAADATAVEARLAAGRALARAGYARDARAQLQWVIDNGRNAVLADAARADLKQLGP